MNIIPPKVRCSVSGHRWVRVAITSRLKSAPMVVCERCEDVGWEM